MVTTILLLSAEGWLRSFGGSSAPATVPVPPTVAPATQVSSTDTRVAPIATPTARVSATGARFPPTTIPTPQASVTPQPPLPGTATSPAGAVTQIQPGRPGSSGLTNVWVVIVHGDLVSETEAWMRARAAAANIPDVGVLLSTDYPNLRPGFWVVYAGRYDNEATANGAAQRARTIGYPGAYPRWLGERRR